MIRGAATSIKSGLNASATAIGGRCSLSGLLGDFLGDDGSETKI